MDTTASTKKRRRWPWLLLAFLLGAGGGLYALSVDDDPPDDTDLLAANPPLPEAENGFGALRRLHAEEYRAPGPEVANAAYGSWSSKPFPLALFAAQAKKNRAVLDRVRVLVRRQPVQLPISEKADDFLVIRGFARALDRRARVRARRGQGAEALDDAFAALHLGLAMEGRPASLLDWSLGLAIQGNALRGLEDVLSRIDLDDAGLAAVDERLAALPEPRGLADALRGDYRYVRRSFERSRARLLAMKAGQLPRNVTLSYFKDEDAARFALSLLDTPLEGLVYKPERTQALAAALVREQVAAAEKGERPPSFERGSAFEELASTNSVGQAVVRLSIGTRFDGCLETQRHPRLLRSMLRVLLALRRFKNSQGRLPNRLEELGPLLPSLPADADGLPLRYRPDLEIVYSVGDDLKDDIAAGADPKRCTDVVLSLKRRP